MSVLALVIVKWLSLELLLSWGKKWNLGDQSRIDAPNFKKANLKLFREVLSRVRQEFAFGGCGVHERWSVFKNHLLEGQEQAIQLCGVVLKEQGRRPAWLRRKKPFYGHWKRGQALQEDCRAVVCLCREKTGKAKAQLDFKLARVV